MLSFEALSADTKFCFSYAITVITHAKAVRSVVLRTRSPVRSARIYDFIIGEALGLL
jgi:hypothetical protein